MRVLAALVMLLAAGPASGAPVPKMSEQPEAGPLEAYRAPFWVRFTLRNGLTVVFVEDRRFPLVTARLALGGGTALSSVEDAGLVEAMAELLTEGTTERGAKEIAQAADALGGELGAYATKDHVVVGAFCLAEHAMGMLKLMAEVVLKPSFAEREVELRKKNMLEELKLKRSQPGHLAWAAFHKKLYGSHPYGIIAATEASIARIDRERLQGLHGKLARPRNALLVIAGDLERSDLSWYLAGSFAGWRRPDTRPLPAAAPPSDEPSKGRRVALYDRSGSDQATLRLGNMAVTERHPDYYPLLVANMVLGGSFASRLMSDLREDRGYTYSVYSDLQAHRSAGAFVVATEVRTGVAKKSLKAVLGQLRRLRKKGVTPEELEQAKTLLVGRFVRGLETQAGVADGMLHGLLHELPEDHLERYIPAVRAVTAERVLAAAREHMRPERLVIAVVGDAGKLGSDLDGFSGSPVVRVDHDGKDLP